MALSNKVKLDMKQTMERLNRLNYIEQIVIISKIDALFEKQQRDAAYTKDPPPQKSA